MSRLQKEKSLLEVGKYRTENDEAEMLRRECEMTGKYVLVWEIQNVECQIQIKIKRGGKT